jgi:hypothetical protein
MCVDGKRRLPNSISIMEKTITYAKIISFILGPLFSDFDFAILLHPH